MISTLRSLIKIEDDLSSLEVLEALVEAVAEADPSEFNSVESGLLALGGVTSSITDRWLEDFDDIFEEDEAIELVAEAVVQLTSSDPAQLWASTLKSLSNCDEFGSVIFLFATEKMDYDFSDELQGLLASEDKFVVSDNVSPYLIDAINSESNADRVAILNALIDPRDSLVIPLENPEDYLSTYNCLVSRICENKNVTSTEPLIAYIKEDPERAKTLDVFPDELSGAFEGIKESLDIDALVVRFGD